MRRNSGGISTSSRVLNAPLSNRPGHQKPVPRLPHLFQRLVHGPFIPAIVVGSRVPGSGVRGRGSGERETTASSLAGKEESSRKEDNSGQGKDGPAGAIAQGGMDGDVDFLREALRVLVEGIMDAEVSSRIGAEYGERCPERVTQRNGYRSGRGIPV